MRIETYPTVKIGDEVVFKESGHLEKCTVQDIDYKDNLKLFMLISTDGKQFTVSVGRYDYAYCPWRFLDGFELYDYNKREEFKKKQCDE
jgi:hypothetical protein